MKKTNNLSTAFKDKEKYDRTKILFQNIKYKTGDNRPDILIKALEYYYKKATVCNAQNELKKMVENIEILKKNIIKEIDELDGVKL